MDISFQQNNKQTECITAWHRHLQWKVSSMTNNITDKLVVYKYLISVHIKYQDTNILTTSIAKLYLYIFSFAEKTKEHFFVITRLDLQQPVSAYSKLPFPRKVSLIAASKRCRST